MEAFVWDQNFVTGLTQVDEQHQELVNLFNALNDSLFSTDVRREALLEETYRKVIDYTQHHFRDEEQVMRDTGIDARHLEAHQALHAQFVEQLGAIWSQRATLVEHPETIVGFLTSWLGLHILGVDQSMARQIALIRTGVAPAVAFDQETAAHDRATRALIQLVGKLYQVLTLQNTELAKANARLEERVQQRTAELAQSNAELREANERLELFSQTDGLLQIANRGYFDKRLVEACSDAFRSRSPLGLLMIDVDFFKRYNDHYGHQAGDACLKLIAATVSGAMLRGTDLLARYGGEELVVILPDTDWQGTQQVAERVLDAVTALALPHTRSDVAGYVTVSIGGTSRIPSYGTAGETLLTEADAALYRAKEAGRNRVVMAAADAAGAA
ncbi:Diguanylate cyclase [Thauera humireducens]|uniref:GGDEF domain-containing protein n=1 Tax=Thauera humireducens TaxID=1134435 RepID=UPI002467A89D|nr:diguanylate cyclase [Thauera humireducens]CAH1748954.1 Diguanylate cyclase [Thauera humireducens]